MKEYPVIEIDPTDNPLQEYFVDCRGDLFSVARIVDVARDLPVFDAPIAFIDLNDNIFADCNLKDAAWHVKKVMEADLSVPIIFDSYGDLADGRHRVIKAILKGKQTIKAKRILHYLEPCRRAEEDNR